MRIGCVVETTGINEDPNELIEEAEMMVNYMMDKRGVKIKGDLIVESSTATVREIASVVASVVYLKDELIE